MTKQENKNNNNGNGLVEVVSAVGTFLTTLAVYIYKSYANKKSKKK